MNCWKVGLLSLAVLGLLSSSAAIAADQIILQPTVLTRNFGSARAPQVQFADLNAQNRAVVEPVFHHRYYGYYGGYGYRPYSYGAYYRPYYYGAYYQPYYYGAYYRPYYAGYGYPAYYGGGGYGGYGGCYYW